MLALCALVVALFVLPFYVLPLQALRGDRDSPEVIKLRGICSLCSCAATVVLLFASVAIRLTASDEDDDRRRRLVEARLALFDPLGFLRSSIPPFIVRTLFPSLAEAAAHALGAGGAAAGAWKVAAREAAEGRFLKERNPPAFVPSPLWATARLLGIADVSATLRGALVGLAATCCLLALPLAQRVADASARLFREGNEEERQRRSRLGSLFSLRERRRRRAAGAAAAGGERGVASSSSPAPSSRLPSATALRDLVFAPLAEEVAFRGCLLPMLLVSSPSKALLASSAAFASAHLHHAVASLLRVASFSSSSSSPCNRRHRYRAVLAGAFVQLLYTSAFGAVAGALMLSTGTLAAPLAAHAAANFLGLPRRRATATAAGAKEGSTFQSRAEAFAGALGVAAFVLMALGFGGGGDKRGVSSSSTSFVPFSGLSEFLGAAESGAKYRALASALA